MNRRSVAGQPATRSRLGFLGSLAAPAAPRRALRARHATRVGRTRLTLSDRTDVFVCWSDGGRTRPECSVETQSPMSRKSRARHAIHQCNLKHQTPTRTVADCDSSAVEPLAASALRNTIQRHSRGAPHWHTKGLPYSTSREREYTYRNGTTPQPMIRIVCQGIDLSFAQWLFRTENRWAAGHVN